MTTAPTPRELLERELGRVDARIRWILSKGRAAFSDDSLAYDVAVVAIVRLAALFEDQKDRYGELLSSVTSPNAAESSSRGTSPRITAMTPWTSRSSG